MLRVALGNLVLKRAACWGSEGTLRGHDFLGSAPAHADRVGPLQRIEFAHADLAGYSVFEETFTQGAVVATRIRHAR